MFDSGQAGQRSRASVRVLKRPYGPQDHATVTMALVVDGAAPASQASHSVTAKTSPPLASTQCYAQPQAILPTSIMRKHVQNDNLYTAL